MRVAVITETFLPNVNGVVTTRGAKICDTGGTVVPSDREKGTDSYLARTLVYELPQNQFVASTKKLRRQRAKDKW